MYFTCYIIIGLVSAAYAVPLSTVYNSMEGASGKSSLSFQARGSLPHGKLISRTEETEPILAKQASHTSLNSDENDDYEPIDANHPRPEVSGAKHLTLGFAGESSPETQKNGMSPKAAGPSQTKSLPSFISRTKLWALGSKLKNRIATSSLTRPEDRSKFLQDVGKDPISEGKGDR
ncbi:hypothetical protein EV368DRAFT_63211 [Lentinula lateritia]|nr:hypothetical protein EV368DRAFT_63211 [Lentinula lateritia]